MRIFVFQMLPVLEKPDVQWRKIEETVQKAKNHGCDLFVLPEFFSTGFEVQLIKNQAATLNDGSFEQLSQISKKYKVYLVGTHPEVRDDKIFNTAVMWDSNGKVIGQFSKWHLFSPLFEDRILSPGDHIEVIETPWGKIGLIVCYDLRFPELTRQITLKGMDILIVPAFWPQPRLSHWKILLQARAIENQIFVVGCNRSSDAGTTNFGHSMVVDPNGEILAEAGPQEVLLNVFIEVNRIQEIRNSIPVFKDRKKGKYGKF